MNSLTPKEIVEALDKYIVGQTEAKRAVAVALRNRWRRQQVHANLRDEITPKNIILIGPTGVGKTEIARRLAKLSKAPFLKIEATKFTEVGYVGRNVESIIHDLVEVAFNLVKKEYEERVQARAELEVAEVLLDKLRAKGLEVRSSLAAKNEDGSLEGEVDSFEERFQAGIFDQEMIEIEYSEQSGGGQVLGVLNYQPDTDLNGLFEGLFPHREKKRKCRVHEARRILVAEKASSLIDTEAAKAEALQRAQESGIVFIDEIDKIAAKDISGNVGISREGVQRDLLPIVEGSSVSTKFGIVKTDHILFIASGAFHVSKPSDLIPEFQGRFPIRVELKSLSQDDFVRILVEPQNSLTKQYSAIIGTEGIDITFTKSAIETIAELAFITNQNLENIGARRLHTIMERVFEDLAFELPNPEYEDIVIDAEYVRERLEHVVKDQDLSRYIL